MKLLNMYFSLVSFYILYPKLKRVPQHPFSGNVIIPSATGVVFQIFLRSGICAILVIKIILTVPYTLETQHDLLLLLLLLVVVVVV
jgi:hypothetical protein